MIEYEHGQGDAARGLDIGDDDVSFHSLFRSGGSGFGRVRVHVQAVRRLHPD